MRLEFRVYVYKYQSWRVPANIADNLAIFLALRYFVELIKWVYIPGSFKWAINSQTLMAYFDKYHISNIAFNCGGRVEFSGKLEAFVKGFEGFEPIPEEMQFIFEKILRSKCTFLEGRAGD